MPKQNVDKQTRTERIQQATQLRRERERNELRQKILKAAGELFIEKGYPGFSLRQVAERIGYSPGTIYLHFKNKEDVLFHVADEGFAIFGDRLLAAYESTNDPRERMHALGHAYINFGMENPAYYKLMFFHETNYLIEDRPEEDFQPRIATLYILQNAVEEAMETGVLRQGDVEDMSNAIWAMVHGVVMLGLSMPDYFDEEQTHRVAEIIVTMTDT